MRCGLPTIRPLCARHCGGSTLKTTRSLRRQGSPPSGDRVMQNRPEENKWRALPKLEMCRPSRHNRVTPERSRWLRHFRISTCEVILWLLPALLFVEGVAETSARRTPANGSTMIEAARTFLAMLDTGQNAKAVLPFNSEERFRWFYTPVSRKGIPLKELKASQREAALALLRAGLSEKGYTKAETIRKLEGVLREIEGNSGPTRDPDLYF